MLSPQVGAHATGVAEIDGVLRRHETNADRGRAPLAPLIRALRPMGEDPQVALFERELPALRPRAGTSGHACDAAELDALHGFIGRFLDLPGFDEGVEALVRCRTTDPLTVLGEWSVLRGEAPEGRRPPYAFDSRPQVVDDSNVDDLRILEDRRYRDVHPRLVAIGALLWENSD